MRRLILIAALSAIVFAKPKPETYKETEDFQYSRSSSDDGTKAGFYGAQRGNMGGNYERAHNMDTLAQHQMSGLVRQVDGELGEGAKTRTGSVYTAANSRGIYGSGHYDLSNLQGRNFAEGESLGNSQSHSSLSSQNSRYAGHTYSGMGSSAGMSSSHAQDARYSGYQTSRHADQAYIDNLQAVDTSQGLGRYESNNQADYNVKYHTQYGSRGRSEIDHSSANLHTSSGSDASSQAHYITTPVRVVIRPGGRVAIPITAPTYSVSPNVVLPENSGVPSDAEVIVGPTPTNKVKHYEASYSYRKQWEKHHALPGDASIVVPTENPFPKNSELYEDAQLLQSSKNQFQNANAQIVHSANTNNDQRAYTKSASSRSGFQAGYNSQQSHSGFESQQNQAGLNSQRQSDLSSLHTQSGLSSLHSQSGLSSQQSHLGLDAQQSHLGFNSRQSSASAATRANTYGRNVQTSGMAEDLTNAVGDIDTKPKSYHSSYSYHKSWERQGDPYVIKPVGPIYDGQASERLTAASSNSAAYSSRQYGSQSRQTHQGYSADCDEQGHVRVARSYNTDQELQQAQNQWEGLGQQTETKLENLEDLGQQTETKFENLEDLGQQQQNKWDNLQDLGQQTQEQWDNLQQLGQQTQNQWDNLQQLGQQTQNQWDNLQQLGQQTEGKLDNLEDLGQQTHRDLEQHQNENLEDFNLSQKQDAVPNFEQQANSENENLDIFNQHQQKENHLTNFEQQTNSANENLDILSQHLQNENQLTNFEQQANSQNENVDEINQHTQKELFTNFEQQASDQNENLDVLSQHVQKENPQTNFEQQVNNQNDKLPNSNNWVQTPSFDHQPSIPPNPDPFNQQFMTVNTANNNHEVFDKNQQNEWLVHQSNSNDFMKPVSQWTDNGFIDLQHHGIENNDQNLFPTLPSSDIEYNPFWHQNKGQDEYNFWHTNHFNNQFENSFSQSSFSTSDTGNPLQGLWSKIDDIGGEGTAIDGNKLFTDNSNFYPVNINQMSIDNNSSYLPVNTDVNLVHTNIDTQSADKQIGHNNLFEEQTERQQTSTTVLPILLSPHSPSLVLNISKSINTHEKQPINTNKKPHSQDEGRGDIEPEEIPFEIEATDKPYKTPQEIETLSLTKETQVSKEGDVYSKPSIIRNGNTGKDLLTTNVQQEKTNENRQYELSSTVQLKATTLPTPEISTTLKSNVNFLDQPRQPSTIIGVIDLTSHPLPDLNKEIPHQQIVKNVEIPDDVQQQDLGQQYEDKEDFGQVQSSWLPTNNLQQGYDQINTEQQFEDFGQVQSSWLPTNNLQQGYDQTNTGQQLEDFQQHENIPEKIYLQDFGQHVQSPSLSFKDVQKEEVAQGNPSHNHDSLILSHSNNYRQTFQPHHDSSDTMVGTPRNMGPIQVSHIEEVNSKNLLENQKVENPKLEEVQPPAATSSEKPGFWKSIGSKLSTAKDKVYSWFSSS